MRAVDDLLHEIKSRGHWEIRIRPSKFKDKKIRLSDCREFVKECQVRQRGWYFPAISNKDPEFFADNDGYVGTTNWQDHKEVWKFFQSGQFIHHFGLWEDYLAEYRGLFGNKDPAADKFPPGTILDVIGALFTITEIFLFASRLAKKDVFGKSLEIQLQLHNTNERKLVITEGLRHLNENYICQIDDIILENKTFSVDEILTNHSKLAMDTTLELFDRFNWSYDEKSLRNVLTGDQKKVF